MLIGVAFVLLAGVAFAAGGSVARLRTFELRWPVLPVVAVAVQLVIIEVVDVGAAAPLLHTGTYVLLGVFAAANLARPGVAVLAAGLAANAAVIAANGGVMPADEAALAATGRDLDHEFENSAVVDDATLAWLGDRFATPSWLPFANVFSVGDVLIVAGGTLAVHQASGSRLYPHRRTAGGSALATRSR